MLVLKKPKKIILLILNVVFAVKNVKIKSLFQCTKDNVQIILTENI